MSLLWSYIFLFVGSIVSGMVLSVVLWLRRADRLEASKSAARVDSMKAALLGRARTTDDWIPDARVQGGMIFNKKHNRFEVSGRLSDDTFSRIFRR